MHVSVSCLLHFLISVFYRDRCIELVYGWTGPILYCKEILVSAKLKSTLPCHYVPNLEIFATAHRLSSRVVSLAGQRWTLSVITRSSSVELSWQYLRLSTFTEQLGCAVYHTERPRLHIAHNTRDSSSRGSICDSPSLSQHMFVNCYKLCRRFKLVCC